MHKNGEPQTPPISLQEATKRTEQYAEKIQSAGDRMKEATREENVQKAWDELKEALDLSGELMGMAANTLMTVAPRDYFPHGWEDVLGVPEDKDLQDPTTWESKHDFDPHDYTSRENIRLAIHASSSGGSFSALQFAMMFDPPPKLMEAVDEQDADEKKEELRRKLNKRFWNNCQGMTPGEIKDEVQAAELSLDNHAADAIDYAEGRTDSPPSMVLLYTAAWRVEVLNDALKFSHGLMLNHDGLPPWEAVTTKGNTYPREKVEQFSRRAKEALRAIDDYIGDRLAPAYPDEPDQLFELAAGGDKKEGHRLREALRKQVKKYSLRWPEEVEGFVNMAHALTQR